jgi:hypothetical protein
MGIDLVIVKEVYRPQGSVDVSTMALVWVESMGGTQGSASQTDGTGDQDPSGTFGRLRIKTSA